MAAAEQPEKSKTPSPAASTPSTAPLNPEERRELEALRNEAKYLRAQIKLLQRKLYGPRSEKIDPSNLQILMEELVGMKATESSLAPAPSADTPTDGASNGGNQRRRQHPGRRPLPTDLPRKEIVIEPQPEQMVAPGPDWKKVRIGEEVTEELDCEPAQFWVNRYIRPKYKWEPPKGTPLVDEPPIVIGELPFRAIEKGRPGYGLLASILVNKFADHLPLYRQRQIFLRYGIDLPLPTLCGWVRDSVDLLYPIYLEQKRYLFEGGLLQGDETPLPQQDPTIRGRNRRAFLFAYCRPWAEAIYDFRQSRGRDGPMEFLKEFRGKLQTDGYDGYNAAASAYGLIRFGCWAHLRRYFERALEAYPKEAAQFLRLIQQIYAVERECKALSLGPEDRLAARREKSLPVVREFWNLVERSKASVLPKDPMGEAITYASNQRADLDRSFDHGDVEIDNNSCEHMMRSPVLGRKNWLHVGSQQAGERAAVCYSLVETCKRLKIDPFAYLRDVLEKVSTWPNKKIRQLIPRFWKESQKSNGSQ